MTTPITKPELSVVIPTLNEAETITALLQSLQQQKEIGLEIILVDGGSTDETVALAEQTLQQHSYRQIIHSPVRGRAQQLNRGATVAGADCLLFLHADSEIDDNYLLARALQHLNNLILQKANENIAAHFTLRFKRGQNNHSLGYYFYESKTHLNRLDTINGDQGFLLKKNFFQRLGGFNESLDYMEDARLARKIFTQGQWNTLPGYILTSARRFELEGLKQRQILNAFLCNFDHIGLHEFFNEAKTAYRVQSNTQTLNLKPFLLAIHNICKRLGLRRSIYMWYKTGGYVASNAWQLAFALDCRHNFANRLAPGEGPTPKLDFFDRYLRQLLNSPVGHFGAAALTFIWFYTLLVKSVLLKK